jgi:hypothetical protein
MKVYVVQYIESNVPEEPSVFLDKRRAEDLWLDYIHDGFYIDGPVTVTSENSEIDQAMEAAYLIDPNDEGNEVRQWTVEISE